MAKNSLKMKFLVQLNMPMFYFCLFLKLLFIHFPLKIKNIYTITLTFLMGLNFSFSMLYEVLHAMRIAMDHEHLIDHTSTLHVSGVWLMHRWSHLL